MSVLWPVNQVIFITRSSFVKNVTKNVKNVLYNLISDAQIANKNKYWGFKTFQSHKEDV